MVSVHTRPTRPTFQLERFGDTLPADRQVGLLRHVPIAPAPPSSRETQSRSGPRTQAPSTSAQVGSFWGRVGNAAAKAVMIGAAGLTLFAAAPVSPAGAAQRQNQIVFVGLNEASIYEVQGLQQRVGTNGVLAIRSEKTQDLARVGQRTFDLKQADARLAYAQALGLGGERADTLAAILGDVQSGARDEAAKLAAAFAEADAGTRFLERLVLSGHSVGYSIWGDNNGEISYAVVGQIADLFPNAARGVQDLMIAACYSGGEGNMDKLRAHFPNLKTLWAYTGSAPGSVSGAVPHLQRWERGTRGNVSTLDRSVAEHTRKGDSVAVWTVTRGYDNGEAPKPLDDVRQGHDAAHESSRRFFTGELVVENNQVGPLRDHYNHIQRLLQHPDLPAAERTALEAERDQVIRLLYFSNVTRQFQIAHGPVVERAYRSLGLAAPNFTNMSRADSLAAIQAFDVAVAAQQAPSADVVTAQRYLQEGLRDLSPRIILATWI